MLKVKNLYCGYNKSNIIKNISFSVNKNTNLCIIGPNGSGKSTLLKSISNIIPFKGDVILEEKSISSMKRKEIAKNIALMSQTSDIYFPYSVFDAVSTGRYVHTKGINYKSNEEKEYIISCIESVGLINEKDKMITQLSGGQLQKVFLARAFAQNPKVLLLDEPTNHLDLKSQIEILEYVNKWKENNNRLVISVIHELNLVRNFSENVILLNNGEIVYKGLAKDVLSSDIINNTYDFNIKEFMIKSLEKWNL